RVRIGNLKVSIPTKCRLTAKVRDRVDVDLFTVDDLTECLEPNHRAIAAHNAEKLILRGWASKGNFKAQLIAIERERRRDVSDDKERCDAVDRGCHFMMLPWDPILARLMRCRMTRRLTILPLSRERRESYVAISCNRCARLVGLQRLVGRPFDLLSAHVSSGIWLS